VVTGQTPRKPKPKRWGLRTLAFLALALASVLTSSILSQRGGDIPLTTLGVLVGLAGAAYCSFRGLKDFRWLPRD